MELKAYQLFDCNIIAKSHKMPGYPPNTHLFHIDPAKVSLRESEGFKAHSKDYEKFFTSLFNYTMII